MSRHEMFVTRLKQLGLYDDDADYNGMIGKAVERMSLVFAEERHSGVSAQIVNGVWNQLFDEYNDGESVMWKPEGPCPK